MTTQEFSEFENGERAALLQVRSFITKHGKEEVDAFCAQRLHDIAMDARWNADSARVGTDCRETD